MTYRTGTIIVLFVLFLLLDLLIDKIKISAAVCRLPVPFVFWLLKFLRLLLRLSAKNLCVISVKKSQNSKSRFWLQTE